MQLSIEIRKISVFKKKNFACGANLFKNVRYFIKALLPMFQAKYPRKMSEFQKERLQTPSPMQSLIAWLLKKFFDRNGIVKNHQDPNGKVKTQNPKRKSNFSNLRIIYLFIYTAMIEQ